jgi:hypothetical protein
MVIENRARLAINAQSQKSPPVHYPRRIGDEMKHTEDYQTPQVCQLAERTYVTPKGD